MFTRKAFALAGLVLAIAVVSPGAALGAQGGTDRPLNLSATGTGVLNLQTGQSSIVLTGNGTHVGCSSRPSRGKAFLPMTPACSSSTALGFPWLQTATKCSEPAPERPRRAMAFTSCSSSTAYRRAEPGALRARAPLLGPSSTLPASSSRFLRHTMQLRSWEQAGSATSSRLKKRA